MAASHRNMEVLASQFVGTALELSLSSFINRPKNRPAVATSSRGQLPLAHSARSSIAIRRTVAGFLVTAISVSSFRQTRADRVPGHEQRIQIRQVIETPRKPHVAVVWRLEKLRRQCVDMDLIPHDS